MDATAPTGDSDTVLSVWTQLYVGLDRVGISEEVVGPFKRVSELRAAVKRVWERRLQHADTVALRVYVLEAEAKSGDNPLKASAKLSEHRTSEEKPLYVVAPADPAPAGACDIDIDDICGVRCSRMDWIYKQPRLMYSVP